MRFRFDEFELDTGNFSLLRNGKAVHVEPLVFDMLRFFVANPGKVLSHDAIVDAVWGGRVVSEATVSSRIKSVRQALGDDGKRQHLLRTVRSRGFVFTGEVERDGAVPPAAAAQAGDPGELAGPAAARIAVLPFLALDDAAPSRLAGEALAQDIIVELSRLHYLFVTARCSSFRFGGRDVDLAEARAVLGAEYFLTGTVLSQGGRIAVTVELSRAPHDDIIWAERFVCLPDELLALHGGIATAAAAAVCEQVRAREIARSLTVATANLDAWTAYHRGLHHLFRFNRADNAAAAGFFGQAVRFDPGFAKAHAGLSAAHFQNGFLGYTPDRALEERLAMEHAARSVDLDPEDPFANLVLGRVEWLRGDPEASIPFVQRSVSLSPSYAFGLYNLALMQTLMGEGAASEEHLQKAMALSPIDPWNHAMLATRALNHLMRGAPDEAVEWAERAARAPHAHEQIFLIAAIANEMNGDELAARAHVATMRGSNPSFGRRQFLKPFRFRDASFRRRVDQSLERLGA